MPRCSRCRKAGGQTATSAIKSDVVCSACFGAENDSMKRSPTPITRPQARHIIDLLMAEIRDHQAEDDNGDFPPRRQNM